MIKSVAKAIDIMRAFSPSEPRLTLAEIARRRGLPKSTVHNLLATLLAYGFIEKAGDDYYALGTAIIALTQAVRVNVELRDRAAPLLRELADACRESVYLTVLDRDHCLYIYAIESPKRLLARIQDAEVSVVAEVVLPRHDLDPRRRAQRLRITMIEPHPRPRQLVQHRRLILLAAIAPKALIADIVGHDQHNVRLALPGLRLQRTSTPRQRHGRSPNTKHFHKFTTVHSQPHS